MPETDQEVFDHFRDGYGDTKYVALIAYARYAEAKYDWMLHQLARQQKHPTEREITQWIASLPNSRFDEIRDGAISQFRAAAEDYMRPRIEEERARAIEGRVEKAAQRVERATSFWRNLPQNVIVSVVASFVFAAMILIILFSVAIYRGDPSIFVLLKELLKEPPAQSTH